MEKSNLTENLYFSLVFEIFKVTYLSFLQFKNAIFKVFKVRLKTKLFQMVLNLHSLNIFSHFLFEDLFQN